MRDPVLQDELDHDMGCGRWAEYVEPPCEEEELENLLHPSLNIVNGVSLKQFLEN